MEAFYQFKLSDLMGVVGATIGIIIAISIQLTWLTSKYFFLSDRNQKSTEELRKDSTPEVRRKTLVQALQLYGLRVGYVRQASNCLTFGLLSFLITAMAASLSVIFADRIWIKLAAILSLFTGFILIAVACFFEIRENILAKRNL